MLEKCRAALRFLQSNFTLVGAIVLTVWLPAGLLIGVTSSGNGYAWRQADALLALLIPLAVGAVLHSAASIEKGSKPSYSAAMRAGLKTWGRLIVTRFVANILIAIASLALIVPGIVLAVRYSLLESVVVLENGGVNSSRKRSASLTKGIGLRLLGAAVVFIGGVLLVLVAISTPFYLLNLQASWGWMLEMVESLLKVGGTVGLAVLAFVFYEDAKTRTMPAGADHALDLRPSPSILGKAAYAVVLAVVVATAFVPALRASLWDWYDVPAGSMKPNVLPGDRVFVDKAAYDFEIPFTDVRLARRGDPARGDLVIFRSPEDGELLLKRVVGLPNEVIEIKDDRLVVNGVPAAYEDVDPGAAEWLAEDSRDGASLVRESLADARFSIRWVAGKAAPSFGPYQVPESTYFVLGDNRHNSRDSRWFGPIDRSAIIGRATGVALSFDADRSFWPRWGRFLSKLS